MLRAGVEGVSGARVVARALALPPVADALTRPLHVVAVGKAASSMAAAFLRRRELDVASALAIGTHRGADLPAGADWIESSHPFPDERSVQAGRRALAVAGAVGADEVLVLLLSGGASALMAAPAGGLTLDDKIATTRGMMAAGADIRALNTVRKHLSAVKGGRLAAACAGATVTLALSDVVGDDLSVIGSGPGVADPSSWVDVREALARFAPAGGHRKAVVAMVESGCRGELADTPKPGDAAMARASAWVVGRQAHAVDAVATCARRLGYEVIVRQTPVSGEARVVAPDWLIRARRQAEGRTGRVCVISAGETTVRVTGTGRGGRNQEFVLALVEAMARLAGPAVVASIGTDGIDGPTDAAGALADDRSLSRAQARGLSAQAHLDDNNALRYFDALGDAIRTGRTDTNVGDLQILAMNLP
jgi:hydroxypyruvate reductase